MPPKLFPYQVEGVNKMVEMDGKFLLFDDAGLGKSCQSMTYAGLYPDFLRPILIICPDSLKCNWEKECRIWLGENEIIHIVEKPLTEAEKEKVKKATITIINYDKLFNRKTNAEDRKESWCDFLRSCFFRFLICDEAQFIKNPFSARTKASLRIADTVKYKGLLSATPIENNPSDLWTLLYMINPVEFQDYHTFARTYSTPKRDAKGNQVYEGGRRLKELNNLLAPYMIRRKLEDVLPQMPELLKSVIPVNLDSYKQYDLGFKHFKEIQTQAPSEKGRLVKGLAALAEMRQAVAKGKLPAVFEYLDTFLETSKEKILVFAYHKEIVSAIEKRYKNVCVKIVGGMSGKQKNESVVSFQDDPNVRILVGNIKSAGVGLTLTSACYTLFVEFLYNPSWIYQALKRNHRIGQKKTVFANFMVARNTIEEHILEKNDIKAEIASQALDDVGMSDVDLLTYLLKIA